MNKNLLLTGAAALAAIVLIFGLVRLFTGSPGKPEATLSPTPSEAPPSGFPSSGGRTGSTLPVNSSLSIRNQSAGDKATVDIVVLAKPGFVVIQKDAAGLPGDIIGASDYFEAGEQRGITVSASLADGKTYWAVLYSDDGNKTFSVANDFPLKDDYGRFIGAKFGASGPPVTVRPSAPPLAIKHDVDIAGFAFSPASLTIRKGEAVIFTNKDQLPHTVTGTGLGGQHIIQPGQSFTLDTSELAPGSYPFHCDFHTSMQGTLIVQ